MVVNTASAMTSMSGTAREECAGNSVRTSTRYPHCICSFYHERENTETDSSIEWVFSLSLASSSQSSPSVSCWSYSQEYYLIKAWKREVLVSLGWKCASLHLFYSLVSSLVIHDCERGTHIILTWISPFMSSLPLLRLDLCIIRDNLYDYCSSRVQLFPSSVKRMKWRQRNKETKTSRMKCRSITRIWWCENSCLLHNRVRVFLVKRKRCGK